MPMRGRLTHRWVRDEGGSSAVEFALIAPLLFLLVFGIIQYGYYFYAMQAGTAAVGDATRRLAVGDCQSSSELKNLIKDKLGAASTTAASTITTAVVYTRDGGTVDVAPGTIGGSVELTATYATLNLHFPFVPLPSDGSVTRTVFARVEDLDASPGGCS